MFAAGTIVEANEDLGLFFGFGDRHVASMGCEGLPKNAVEAVQGVEPDGFILNHAATEVQGQDQSHRSGDDGLVHNTNINTCEYV